MAKRLRQRGLLSIQAVRPGSDTNAQRVGLLKGMRWEGLKGWGGGGLVCCYSKSRQAFIHWLRHCNIPWNSSVNQFIIRASFINVICLFFACFFFFSFVFFLLDGRCREVGVISPLDSSYNSAAAIASSCHCCCLCLLLFCYAWKSRQISNDIFPWFIYTNIFGIFFLDYLPRVFSF